MIRLFEYIRSRLGAKVIAAFLAALAIAAVVQIIVTFQFGHSIAEQAASESSEALRARARATLERLTSEQAHRYNQIFSEAGNRSRMLAWQAGHHLTTESESDPAFPLDLRWRSDKAFHFNGPDAPISLLHWGDAAVTAPARQQMHALTHLDTPLNRAQAEIQGADAAWILTDKRVGAYAPNRPGIEATAPADEAAMLESRSYRTGNAAPGQTRWTEVYEDVAGTGPIITAATPIYGPDNKAFLGVAGLDLTIRSTVNRVLTQDPLGIDPPADANGPPAEMSFLMDDRTRPVALPVDNRSLLGLPANTEPGPGEALREAPLAEAGPADLRRAARRAVENDHLLVDDINLDGETYMVAFHTIPATDWVMANVVAEKALLSSVAITREAIGQRVGSMTVILAVVGAGLMLLMATGLMVYFRRAFLRPLGRLAEATERMGSGQYRVELPVRGEDELARVSQSFNELSDRLADLFEDLEQRVRARTREAESARDYFRSILDSSPVGIAFLDGDRRIQQVNPALEELFGREADDILGRSAGFFYQDPSEFERVGLEAYPTLQAGGIFRTVVTLEGAEGKALTVSILGQAVNPNALEEGYIWVLQDITEQRNRERTLQMYKAVFESSRDAVTLTTENGYLDCNPAALTLYEVPDRATFTRYYTPAKLSPPYQPDGRPSEEAAQAYIQQAFEQGQAFFEWEHRSTSGHTFPTEILFSRVDLEEGPILQAVMRDISEQKAAFEKIRRARDRAETYFEQVRVMMLVLDTNGRVTAINQRGCEVLGLEREAVLGSDWITRFVRGGELDHIAQIFDDLKTGREGVPDYPDYHEHEILTASGERRFVAFHNTMLYDTRGGIEGILASGEDVTHRRELEAEQRLLATAFQTSQALMITDPSGTIERVNAAFTQITGYEPAEAIGANPKILASGEHDAAFYAALWRQLNEQDHWEGEIWNRRKNGEIYPQWESITAVRDEQGKVARYVAVFHEITEQKRLEAELARLATHDSLTDLYNRAKLYELLEQARRECNRYGTPFSVILFDIDHFKAVNDRYGHQAGDEVLRELARRVNSALREPDAVGRWGGEEFLVLATHTGARGAAELAERLRQIVARTPFEGVGSVTISLGVAPYEAGETVEELEGRVDEALYTAKEAGRDRVVVAEPSTRKA